MPILSQDGKESKSDLHCWEQHKTAAEILSKRLSRMRSLSPGRAIRMFSCGDQLISRYCPSCGYRHIIHMSRCRDRLCPICSWRLAIKRYHEMKATIELLSDEIQERNLKACMITLTIKNCKHNQLRNTLSAMSKAWVALQRSKAFHPVVGWGRCTEVTFNQSTKEMHPHYHILALVPEDTSPWELEEDIRAAWQRAAKLPYVPVIDVRAAYCKDGDESIIACAGEAFSYSIKPMTVSGMSDYYLESFAQQMAGVRLTGYGGIIKEARAKLGLYDDQDEQEDHRPDICTCGTKLEEMLLAWAAGGYQRIQKAGNVE